jgi:hypothetical protein
MKTSSAAILLLALALTPPRAIAQTAASLGADISATQAEIQKAEEDDQKVTGGLVKSLISLRLATLRQTLALLDQRSKAIAARTTLQYTVDGKPFVPPSDAPAQIAAVEKELADTAAKIVKQEAEVARYSGGLVQATAMATLATLRQTQAMLEQKRLALKYGLPQFIGFKDMLPVASAATSENRPRAASPPDSCCLRPSSASRCLAERLYEGGFRILLSWWIHFDAPTKPNSQDRTNVALC